MKKITLLCLALAGAFFSQAQHATVPTYYVDSQVVSLKKIYFNPENISSINVFKDSVGAQSNGSVYISLKRHLNEFVSLREAVRNKLPDVQEKKLLFIIDGQVIKDTAGIRIDPSFAVSMHAVDVKDLPFRCEDPALTNIVFIEMGPRSPVNLQMPMRSGIILRGAVAVN